MFSLKKNLLYIFLLFCLFCINIQSACSYGADINEGNSKIQGDNGESAIKINSNNKSPNFSPFNNNINYKSNKNNLNNNPKPNNNYVPYNNYAQNYNYNYEAVKQYQKTLVNDEVKKSIKEEKKYFESKIFSLQAEVNTLKKDVKTLKNQNSEYERYFLYMIISLVIVFILTIMALFKSNRNPYDRL